MGDLARMLVQDGVLSPEGAARAQKAARNGDLASAALDLRLAEEAALVRGLARTYECPGIDFSRSIVPVAYLGFVAAEFCQQHRVLPISIGKAELVLAMAEPDDISSSDEVRFLTGKKVHRCVAVASALHRAIEGVVRARREGALVWRGERAPTTQDGSAPHAAIVKPNDRLGAAEVPEPSSSETLAELLSPFQPQAHAPAPPLQRQPPMQQAPQGYPPPRPAPQQGYPQQSYPPQGYPPSGYGPPQPAPQDYGAPPPGFSPAPQGGPGYGAGYGPPAQAAPAYAPPQAAPAYAPPPHALVHEGPGQMTVRLQGVAGGKVALAVDDDASVRQLVSAVLRKMGVVVLQAGDGKTALDMVRDARPDLVVLDAMMPGMHGFEVCRAIKGDRALRLTRVVLCSAIYRGTVGTDAQTAFGADAFVEKPFRLEELTRVFKVALVGPVAAETAEERAAREEAQVLWRAASEALAVGRIPQAAQLAHNAATKDPWSAEAHYYLGHALSRQGMVFEAVAAYERAAELRPDIDATHQCLAQAYERLGFQKSAREAWSRAIETCRDPARKRAMQQRLMALFGP
jgi:CheY-like chemotaxis protein